MTERLNPSGDQLTTEQLATSARSRRGLLTAAVGATAAAVAASVARVVPTRAADGDEAILGVRNESRSTTTFYSEDSWALSGNSTTSRGVNGKSTSGQGVHGESIGSAGVAGVSQESNGVHGTSWESRGVWGESTKGPGVVGQSTNSTGVEARGVTGVLAASDQGYALHTTSGRVRFDGISGIVTLPANETAVEIETDVPVTNDTFVLLTPRSNLGTRALWYQIPDETGKVTVYVDEPRSRDSRIAYLLLERGPTG